MGADMQEATAASRPTSRPKGPRLVGLDMLRGLTMVVMLLVDYTGGCYPAINHAPRNGLHLADLVMPFFLWVSGLSMSISVRVRPGDSRMGVFLQVGKRALRLFVLGIVVQGSWFHVEDGVPTLHLDLSSVRIMGILQRIAIAFIVVAAAEIFVPEFSRFRHYASARPLLVTDGAEAQTEQNPLAHQRGTFGLWIFGVRAYKAIIAVVLVVLGTCLTYGVTPPQSWPGCAATVYHCGAGDSPTERSCKDPGGDELRTMGCSAVSYLDSKILGINHVYVRGSDRPSWPPTWGFDPEGLVTSLSAVFPMYFGLHVGCVWRELKDVKGAIVHWVCIGALAVVCALLLSVWVPLNKRLWSPSYSLLNCGIATLTYACLFGFIDGGTPSGTRAARLRDWGKVVLAPLQWLGTNCILFFVLSDCCGVLDWLLRSLTWGVPYGEKNLMYWFQSIFLMKWLHLGNSCTGGYDDCGPARMVYVWIQIVSWMLVCGVLHRKGIFWKI
mmetsp:Transcript_100360/g.199106  ORF Transcript_100360/g.199106 Transcript_100360/m.199106 type:complete len:497 (+) Transcript_100360:85-1575(+)